MQIGPFEIYVADPHPCWVSIKYAGKEFRLHHGELRLLEFAVQEAMRQAKNKLPESCKDEV